MLGCRDGEIEINPLFVYAEEEDKESPEHVTGALKRTGSAFVQQRKLLRAGERKESG